jgi:hypothetical protein
MAKKPTTDATYVPAEMDYAAHEATWNGFTQLLKWSIIGLAILVVFLYIVIRP